MAFHDFDAKWKDNLSILFYLSQKVMTTFVVCLLWTKELLLKANEERLRFSIYSIWQEMLVFSTSCFSNFKLGFFPIMGVKILVFVIVSRRLLKKMNIKPEFVYETWSFWRGSLHITNYQGHVTLRSCYRHLVGQHDGENVASNSSSVTRFRLSTNIYKNPREANWVDSFVMEVFTSSELLEFGTLSSKLEIKRESFCFLSVPKLLLNITIYWYVQ